MLFITFIYNIYVCRSVCLSSGCVALWLLLIFVKWNKKTTSFFSSSSACLNKFEPTFTSHYCSLRLRPPAVSRVWYCVSAAPGRTVLSNPREYIHIVTTIQMFAQIIDLFPTSTAATTTTFATTPLLPQTSITCVQSIQRCSSLEDVLKVTIWSDDVQVTILSICPTFRHLFH